MHTLDASERLAMWQFKGLQEIAIRLECHEFEDVVDRLQAWRDSNLDKMAIELASSPVAASNVSIPAPASAHGPLAGGDTAGSGHIRPHARRGYNALRALELFVGGEPQSALYEDLLDKLNNHADVRHAIEAKTGAHLGDVLETLAHALTEECNKKELQHVTGIELMGHRPWTDLYVTAWLEPNRGHRAIVSLDQVLRTWMPAMPGQPVQNAHS